MQSIILDIRAGSLYRVSKKSLQPVTVLWNKAKFVYVSVLVVLTFFYRAARAPTCAACARAAPM